MSTSITITREEIAQHIPKIVKGKKDALRYIEERLAGALRTHIADEVTRLAMQVVCPHRRQVVDMYGHADDVRERIVCVDCGADLTPPLHDDIPF
ncbi:MAG: hypothetical protein AB1509_12715 [Chloroflexota bacterium]